MARRRRKLKRQAPPWKSAIGFSVGVHAFMIVCLIGFGWRYLTQNAPGTEMTIHEVMLGDLEAGGGIGSPNTHTVTQPSAKVSQGPRRAVGVGIQPPENSLGQAAPTAGEGPSPSLTASEGLGQSSQTVNGSTTGASTGTGTGTGAGDPTLTEIRRRIEQSKRYPIQAREQHIEGKVGVQFSIQANGQVQNVHVTQSSGTPVLDDAAIQAVQHSAPLPYYGNAINLSLAFRLH